MGGGFFKKCIFRESRNSQCLRTLVFRKVEVHLACASFSESGNSPCLRTLVFQKMEAFFAFSKVEIHNACKH